MKNKRLLKRKKLVNQLLKKYLNKFSLNHIKTRILGNETRESYLNTSYHKIDYNKYGIKKESICVNLIFEKTLIKNGYSNSYYPGRHEKLFFIKNNRKLALRFTILHEIAHCLPDILHNEFLADKFAIEQLQKEGLLKC